MGIMRGLIPILLLALVLKPSDSASEGCVSLSHLFSEFSLLYVSMSYYLILLQMMLKIKENDWRVEFQSKRVRNLPAKSGHDIGKSPSTSSLILFPKQGREKLQATRFEEIRLDQLLHSNSQSRICSSCFNQSQV